MNITSAYITSISTAALLAIAGCSSDRGETAESEPREPSAAHQEASDEEKDDESTDGDERGSLSEPSDDALGQVPEGYGLELGAELPDVNVLDREGNESSLRELAGGKPVLVSFYRGGWCPYCTSQVRELTVQFDGFSSRDVALLMVSADEPDAAAKTEASYDVPFPLLSDAALEAHAAFRIIDESESADGEPERSAIPSLFLFNADGELVWQHVDKDLAVRPRAEQLFQVLEKSGFEA